MQRSVSRKSLRIGRVTSFVRTYFSCSFKGKFFLLVFMTIRSTFWLIALISSFVGTASAQSVYDLALGEPTNLNGVEYGYSIYNECQKEVTNVGTFRRYELVVYVANKTGGPLLFPTRQTSFGVKNQDLLAHFDCLNATAAKLTSKTTAVRARPQSTADEVLAQASDDKPVLNEVQLRTGHLLENGETITKNLIVIVPDGEKPQMRVRIHTPGKARLR